MSLLRHVIYFHGKKLEIHWMWPRSDASMHSVPEMGNLPYHHAFSWFSVNTGAIDLKQKIEA